MDMGIKEKFSVLWQKYFSDAELPIVFYYTNEEGRAEPIKPGSVPECIVGALAAVRKGSSLSFDVEAIGCFGGKRHLGFTDKVGRDFPYFLSCGIPGKLSGERYKKSPEIARQAVDYQPKFKAPGRFLVFKRWDRLTESDEPEVVIFFATPDVLSGVFHLANFDQAEPNGVFAPFGSGCSTIVQYPYAERESQRPRAVIGMFDVSARPFVPRYLLTFSVPMNRFVTMIQNMEESFLITDSWKKVQKRIGSAP